MSLDDSPLPSVNRKVMLQVLGSLGGAVLLDQCSGGGASPAATPTASAVATITPTPAATAGVHATATPTAIASATATATAVATTSSSNCVVTDEGEIGPYFADDSASGFDRSNIVSNIDGTDTQTGIPLVLNLYVVDTESNCAAYSGAQIDIWHCNASGVYSDISSENTSSDSYLRGYQITNASGYVQFTTIVPGWYSGRTTHVHLRIRSSYSEASSTSDGTNTTQLFFPQSMIDYISASVSPYSSEGTNPTTNASDRVYSEQVDGQTLLTLSGSYSAGFTATYTIGLPITQTYSGGAPNTASVRKSTLKRL